MNIKMFGADNCVGCKTVKDILIRKGVEFEYLDVDNPYCMEEASNYGVRSIPTVIIKLDTLEHIFTGASKPTIDSLLLRIDGGCFE